MKIFQDRKLKKIAKDENIKAPKEFYKMIDNTLENLAENKQKKFPFKLTLKIATVAIISTFIILPNLSPEVSYAMEQIPVIGNIVKVITIRNYFYKEGNSEMNLDIPTIENKADADKNINKNVEELTNKIMTQFLAEKDEKNHIGVDVKTDIVENSEKWFTLKLTITETRGSSSLDYKYYHIDRKEEKIIKLVDLFESSEFKEKISKEIKKQMQESMDKDENIVYYIDAEKEEWSFTKIADDQNFYFAPNGNIVIVFNKYEVGPGVMGAPEFEIDKKIYNKYLKEKYT